MPYDLPRIPLPTSASSAQLATLPTVIRRQALFSARLNLLDPVVRIGAEVKAILDGGRSDSEARRDIRAALSAAGYRPPPDADGGLRDHTSKTRLDLILNQQVRAARGYGKYASDMSPVSLDLWPAQELIRVMSRRKHRGTWKSRWRDAGGRLFGGRMIALKTSPVWTNISRFGVPYPPYDYGSGMGVADVSRDEAVRLGLIGPADALTPDDIPFPEVTEARMPDIGAMSDLQAAVARAFGDSATFDRGVLSLGPPADLPKPDTSASAAGLRPLSAASVTAPPPRVTPDEARHMIDSGQASAGSPGSRLVRFGRDIERHWRDKGYSGPSIDARMRHIRQAFAAVQEPQEVWERPDGTWYLKEFHSGTGGKAARILVQTDRSGNVITWIPSGNSPAYFDKKRTGSLLVKEGS